MVVELRLTIADCLCFSKKINFEIIFDVLMLSLIFSWRQNTCISAVTIQNS